jgi:hypothetical protein
MKISSLGRAIVFGTIGNRFNSCIFKQKIYAPSNTAIAQRTEHLATNQGVGGSNPSSRTREFSFMVGKAEALALRM